MNYEGEHWSGQVIKVETNVAYVKYMAKSDIYEMTGKNQSKEENFLC